MLAASLHFVNITLHFPKLQGEIPTAGNKTTGATSVGEITADAIDSVYSREPICGISDQTRRISTRSAVVPWRRGCA
jgi:hypothetical protein